jgi:hypothetical protein
MLRHFVITGLAALFLGAFVATDASALETPRLAAPTATTQADPSSTYPDLGDVLDIKAASAPLGIQVAVLKDGSTHTGRDNTERRAARSDRSVRNSRERFRNRSLRRSR